MVFCKECHQKVEDCPHFVSPISAKRIEVFDIKVKTLAYDPDQRTLEIAFKTGQVWQLLGGHLSRTARLYDFVLPEIHCATV